MARLERLPDSESPELLDRVHGVVLSTDSAKAVTATSVPSLERSVIVPPGDAGRVLAFSNVLADGTFVFVENEGAGKRLMLASVGAERPLRQLAEWKGRTTEPTVGSVALSSDGRRAVLAWQCRGSLGGHLLGWLQRVDLETGASEPIGVAACVNKLAFLPGDREVLAGACRQQPGWLAEGDLGQLPAPDEGLDLTAVDVASGAVRVLAGGCEPVLATDGGSVIFAPSRSEYGLLRLARGSIESVHWPGDLGGPLAFATDDWVAYVGWPTEGADVIATRFFSPTVGPRELGDVKLASLHDGRFVTVHRGVDPRHAIAFSARGTPGATLADAARMRAEDPAVLAAVFDEARSRAAIEGGLHLLIPEPRCPGAAGSDWHIEARAPTWRSGGKPVDAAHAASLDDLFGRLIERCATGPPLDIEHGLPAELRRISTHEIDESFEEDGTGRLFFERYGHVVAWQLSPVGYSEDFSRALLQVCRFNSGGLGGWLAWYELRLDDGGWRVSCKLVVWES